MAYLHFICQYFIDLLFSLSSRPEITGIHPAEVQRLEHNYSAVKAESCGFAVLRSHDSTFFCLGSSIVFIFWCFFTFCFQYCPAFFLQHFFSPRLSVNLKTKICLNWLQRAQRGFVSMVMRLLIGPEAQAANRPLLACRGLCLLVSLMNSFADGGWQGLIYQAGPEGWWGRRWLEQVKKKIIKGEQIYKSCCRFGFLMSSGSKVVLPPGVEFGLMFGMVCDQSFPL